MLVPVAPFDAPLLTCTIDGRPVEAQAGQTVLTVMLTNGAFVRRHDVDGEKRAGFCLMGACQDCWVWFSPDRRGRACTTPVVDGMRIVTSASYGGGDG
ncbi:MAG: (2Fe-2S)-binding protein [Salinarimonadaceae bacterium]|nr:MAG: (2Fe-2S)-binding protein [Salinarimonadaceae bacterium]